MITKEFFGKTSGGDIVSVYTLTNSNGLTVKLLDYGCTVQSIIVPDKFNRPTDVALGYDDILSYEKGTCFYGAFVGRYANRIGKSSFPLDGKIFKLTPNENENHLHGIFPFVMYGAEAEDNRVTFKRVSPDGEDGFPGNLKLEITYTLTEENGLITDYRARTDKATPVNLTNHTYFNLSGHASGDILNTLLRISSRSMTPADPGSIPTGEIKSTEGTAFDFRAPKAIGRDIDSKDAQLEMTGGYDHNLIIDGCGSFEAFATAVSPVTGIRMDVYTTQPAVQFYAGGGISGDAVKTGKGGAKYERRAGFCLETQHFPDSPNHPDFPDTVLREGGEYHETTEYRFLLSD